jgi:hypothetical protein
VIPNAETVTTDPKKICEISLKKQDFIPLPWITTQTKVVCPAKPDFISLFNQRAVE